MGSQSQTQLSDWTDLYWTKIASKDWMVNYAIKFISDYAFENIYIVFSASP